MGILASCMVLGAVAAHAELLVVGNDGHQPPEPGQQPGRVADSVAVVDFNTSAPRLLGLVAAPASIIGPPEQIVVAPNERWALVAASTKADPADPIKTVPDSVISVIDISTPARPRVIQTVHAGTGVYAIALNKSATLLLAGNQGEDSISIFTVAGNTLTPAGKVQLPAGSRPSTVGFFPDGRRAFVVTGTGSQLLAVDGSTVTLGGPIANVGGLITLLTADGRRAIANGAMRPVPAAPGAGGAPPAGGRGPAAPPVATLFDVATGNVIATAPLGAGTEGITLSPDGTMMAAVITNGSHSAPTAPGFNDFGLLRLYRVTPISLTPVAEAHTGHWCQNGVFSRDNRTILVTCSVEKEVQVFRYDGNATLTRDDAAALKFEARPAGMATVSSR
jgi:DNA-binding beta-propeller fold protein YncE